MLDEEEEQAIVRAITRAERGHRGEIRVHLEPRCGADAEARARTVYARQGLHRTRDDTAVLLYIAPESRRCAIHAGRGVRGGERQEDWKRVTDLVARGYAEGRGAAVIAEAVRAIGVMLRSRAPGEDRHGDELPNSISLGGDAS